MLDTVHRWRRKMKRWSLTRDRGYQDLLDEGEQRRRMGDLEGAVMCFQAAQKNAQSPHVVSTLEEHLRLPQALQESGQMGEARSEFRKLLEDGYPGQLENPSIQWVERSIIYDRMRLAFEQEGRLQDAAVYAAFSFLADAYSRFLDDARDGYEDDVVHLQSRSTAQARAEMIVEILSPNAGKEKVQERVSERLFTVAHRLGDEDISSLMATVETVIRSQD